MFECSKNRCKDYVFRISTLCLFGSLLIAKQGSAYDYLEVEMPGISGIGVYYNEMFRDKVNPAAVGYRKKSITVDVANTSTESDTFSFRAEYNTNWLSISDVRSESVRARISFEADEVEEAYDPIQGIDELFLATVSFSIPVGPVVRIGFGQRVSTLTGLYLEPDEQNLNSDFASFDIALTSFAADVGAAVRLSRNLYLSLYGRNVLYFTFGELSIEEGTGGRTVPELDLKAPIIIGGGSSIALGRLVVSSDLFHSPEVGNAPGVRVLASDTLFLGGERFRLKLGVGAQTIASSDWRDHLKAETVASFWVSERLSIRYAIGIWDDADEDSRVYHRAGVSWRWK